MKTFNVQAIIGAILLFAIAAILFQDQIWPDKKSKAIPAPPPESIVFDPADRILFEQVEKTELTEADILDYIRDAIFSQTDGMPELDKMNFSSAHTGVISYKGEQRRYLLMPFGKTLFVEGISGVFFLGIDQKNPVEFLVKEPLELTDLGALEQNLDPTFLKTVSDMTAGELHRYAENLNWDYGYKRVYEIIDHPQVDPGTVLLLYWYAQPDYFAPYNKASEVPQENRNGFAFIKHAEKRLLENDFKSNAIRFSPMEEMFFTTEQIAAIQNLKAIPDTLKRPNF